MLLVLAMLALVLVLAYFTTRFVGKRYGAAGQGSKLIRVLDRVPISQDKQLLLIIVAGKAMLIGAAPQGVSKLCDIDVQDLPPVPDDAPGPAFSQILDSALRGFGTRAGRSRQAKEGQTQDEGNQQDR